MLLHPARAQLAIVEALASRAIAGPSTHSIHELAHAYVVECIVGWALEGREGQGEGDRAGARELAQLPLEALPERFAAIRARLHARLDDPWSCEHADAIAELVRRVAPELALFDQLRALVLDPAHAEQPGRWFGPVYESYRDAGRARALGQFFTDAALVDRVLVELGFVADRLASSQLDSHALIDPSCGAGVFLDAAARERIAAGAQPADLRDAIVGLDVAAFPLFLARMSLALRGLDHAALAPPRDAITHFLDHPGQLGRFAFVVGNPPYVGYNASASLGVEILARIKARRVSLADVFGWNLHSAPGRRKKYPPKPNLYAFFVALGVALLAPGGRLAYVLPRTLLTEPDYDVVRHHLGHDVTIDAILEFDAAVFAGVGLGRRKPVATSSLVLVCTKQPPPPEHEVACARVRALAELDATPRTRLRQAKLRERVENWAFVGWDPAMVERYEHYLDHSEPMQVYFDHERSIARFGTRFHFDVGFILDPARVCESYDPERHHAFLDFREFVRFTALRPTRGYPRDPAAITIPKASQGLAGLRRHKLVWPKSRAFEFYYTDADVLPSMSHAQYIASDRRDEVLFLFAVLRSSLIRTIYAAMFELGAEQQGMFVAVKRIKEFVRPPKIETPAHARIKAEIIRGVDEALALEHAERLDVDEQDRRLAEVDALVLRLYKLGGVSTSTWVGAAKSTPST